MSEGEKLADPNVGELRKRLSEIDEVAQLLLNTHLEIELEMDDVMELALFHPEHLKRLRLGFFQRLQITRALCPDEGNDKLWELILSLNKLRNTIAHGAEIEERTTRLEALKQQLLDMAPERTRCRCAL